MTYFVLGMGPTQPDEHHIWSDENVDWIEPPDDEPRPDHGDPIGPAMCGAEEYAPALDPMSDRAGSLRDFLRRADHEVCPRCVLALERRHALPADEYRTNKLDQRIKMAQACTDASQVGEKARELIEQAKSRGLPTADLTLTVSPEVREQLEAHSVRVAMDEAGPFGGGVTEYSGVPVIEDQTFETAELDIEVDMSLSTDAMDRLREAAMDEARSVHPSCRSTVTMGGDDVEVITATVVQASPHVVLDDGESVYFVKDDDVLEDVSLGQEVQAPVEALDRRGDAPTSDPDVAVVQERLTNIAGVGTSKAKALFDAGYYDEDAVREATQEELSEVPAIGNALAARIKADVGDLD